MQVVIEKKDSIQHPYVYKDDLVEIYMEDATIGWCVHCYVNQWSKGIYDHILTIWSRLMEVCPVDKIYAVVQNDKLRRFAELFGFESIDDLYKGDDKIGELMCYEL